MAKAYNPSVKDLLLSHKEMNDKYQQLHEEKYDYPYTYQIKSSNSSQILYFLGVHHVYDPTHPQIHKIKRLWIKFLKDTDKNNCIVLTEGGIRPVEESEEKAILKHGEAGLLAFLSNREDIPNISPEPDEKFEIKELEKQFSKEEIEYAYFARTVLQWNKLKEKPEFNTYIQRYLDRDKLVSGWKDFDFSVANLIAIHDKKYNHKFDPVKCEQCVYSMSNPAQNPVSSSSGHIRDEYIVKEIINLWEKGKSIFIVYGSGHAIVCEKAIKHFLKM